jgi:hypothetical protein
MVVQQYNCLRSQTKSVECVHDFYAGRRFRTLDLKWKPFVFRAMN